MLIDSRQLELPGPRTLLGIAVEEMSLRLDETPTAAADAPGVILRTCPRFSVQNTCFLLKMQDESEFAVGVELDYRPESLFRG